MKELDRALRDAEGLAFDECCDAKFEVIDQVPKETYVAHIFLHVNVAHPGACIVMLLCGEVDHADKQEAMQLSTPCDHRLRAIGKAIFDGRLAQGFWALVEQVKHRFCWRFPKGKKHRGERERSHCCHTHSTGHVNVYSSTTWENGKFRERPAF